MQSQDQLLRWLCHTPASDINFKGALENATLETLDAALDHRARAGAKTAFKAIRAEIHRRYEESGGTFEKIPEWDAYQESLGDSQPSQPLPAAPTQSEPKSHDAVAPGKVPTGDPVTLAKLEEMPVGRSVSILQMTIPELKASYDQLSVVEQGCERLSGIVAILKGIVLDEVKAKVGHGNFNKWLGENFSKSRKTANQYRRLAASFAKNNPKVTFETLGAELSTSLAVLDQNQLDLNHPVVAQVAKWTGGKSAYQLLLELEPAPKGGNNHPTCPHCDADLASKEVDICPKCGAQTGFAAPTPEQRHAEKVEALKTAAIASFENLHTLHADRAWMVLNDGELEGAINHLEAWLQEAKAWRKMTKKEREASAAKLLMAEGGL